MRHGSALADAFCPLLPQQTSITHDPPLHLSRPPAARYPRHMNTSDFKVFAPWFPLFVSVELYERGKPTIHGHRHFYPYKATWKRGSLKFSCVIDPILKEAKKDWIDCVFGGAKYVEDHEAMRNVLLELVKQSEATVVEKA